MPVGAAYEAGARPGMRVLTIDGRAVSEYGPGQLPARAIHDVEVVTADEELVQVEWVDHSARTGPAKFSIWSVGGAFSVLGAIVLLRRPDLWTARWFAVFAGLVAAGVSVVPASAGAQPPWALFLQIIALLGVGATCLPFVNLLVRSGEGPRWPLVSILFIVAGVVFAVAYTLAVFFDPELYEVLRQRWSRLSEQRCPV